MAAERQIQHESDATCQSDAACREDSQDRIQDLTAPLVDNTLPPSHGATGRVSAGGLDVVVR